MGQNPEHFAFSTDHVSSFAFTIAKTVDTDLSLKLVLEP